MTSYKICKILFASKLNFKKGFSELVSPRKLFNYQIYSV